MMHSGSDSMNKGVHAQAGKKSQHQGAEHKAEGYLPEGLLHAIAFQEQESVFFMGLLVGWLTLHCCPHTQKYLGKIEERRRRGGRKEGKEGGSEKGWAWIWGRVGVNIIKIYGLKFSSN